MHTLLFAVVLVATLVATTASAWWCQGHMLVSEIALQLVSSDVSQKVQQIASNFENMGPWPMSPDSVQMACWADDLKDNLLAMNGWHYMDTPYNPDNITLPDSSVVAEDNCANQLSDVYSSLQNSPNNWESTFSLAWMIHLMGDIHQPFHCISLYNKDLPNGDMGGNAFTVYDGSKKTNLHSYWDSVGATWTHDYDRPMNSTASRSLTSWATDLLNQYNSTFKGSVRSVSSPKVIANESYTLAIKYGYADLHVGDTLSKKYHDDCVTVAASRVVLAGIRLAHQYNYIFGK